MALVLKNRVKEETTTTGTGAFALGGASAQFDTFQTYMSNGDTTYYSIAQSTAGTDEWEIGIGTWNTGNTLSRTTVLAGSNGTSAVDFSAGTKEIFMTYPAEKAIFKDGSNNVETGTGKLLIGKSTDSIGTAGTAISSTLGVRAAVDGNIGLLINRLSSDGNLIDLRKDSTQEAVIGFEYNDNLFLKGIGHAGVALGGSSLYPSDGDSTTGGDASYDLGTSSYRWRNAYLSGNLAVGGTVDGRDVATDGTKLDGIETGATADQTKSDIDALNINADQVDGLEASQFLRSDAHDSTSHNLDINGGSLRVGGTSYAMAMSTNGNTSNGSIGHTASNKEGIFWHTSNNYSIARTSGAWSAPAYQRLQIDWPTGIIISTEPAGTYTNSHTEFQSAIKSNIAQNEKIILSGSNDPYIRFQEGTTNKAYIQWAASGFLELVNQEDSSRIRIKDDIEFSPDGSNFYDIWHASNATGAGYVDVATGNYGTIKVDDDRGVTYAGYAIRDDWVLMSSGADNCGIYNDTDNEWGLLCRRNAEVELYYNASVKLETASDGITVSGNVDVSGQVEIGGEVILKESTDRADLLQITSSTSTWAGIQIRNSSDEGRWSFMTDGSYAGIYDDQNNRWAQRWYEYGQVQLYYSNSLSFETSSTGVSIPAGKDIRMTAGDWTGETTYKIQAHSSHVYHQYNNSGQMIFRNSSGTNRFYFDGSGNFTAGGNVTAYSDIRLKKDIVTIDSPIEKIKQMRGVYYKEIETDRERTGVIAQEVEPVLPEVVLDHEDVHPETGETSITKTVDYGNMVGLLIEAIKEQQKQIDELKDRLA